MAYFKIKYFRILLIIILIILLTSEIIVGVSLYIYILVFLFTSIILFIGTYFIQANFYFNSICTLPENKGIAITFDDGPDPNVTPQILEVLKKYNAKATFFVIGNKLDNNIELLQEIITQGHKLGNHSFTHSYYFDFFSTKKVKAEIEKTNIIIEQITGEKSIYFRPPFGLTNPNIARAIKKNKMISIGWSIRSLDTVKDEQTVLKRLSKVKAGDIILFHDTKINTPKILDKFLRLCSDKGIQTTFLN